jgi:predicted nucleic-acid-binding protein
VASPRAIDTSLLVRLVTNDDLEQARRAAAAIDDGPGCFVPLTVSLELEWVLRGAYRLGCDQVVAAFEGLLGLRQLHFEREDMLCTALQRHQQGLDFADALHHLGSADCAVMFSFDTKLIDGVNRLRLKPPVQAP